MANIRRKKGSVAPKQGTLSPVASGGCVSCHYRRPEADEEVHTGTSLQPSDYQ